MESDKMSSTPTNRIKQQRKRKKVKGEPKEQQERKREAKHDANN